MDPNEFLFLILPLAAMVTILVVVVLYLARKEDTVRHKEVETLNELMRTGTVNKENFSAALQGLVSNKLIDKNSCERLRKMLEDSFNEAEES
jgi:Glu-tRNA(Gln) amidotransferase subunit E-like FAD-binding protein